MKTYNYKSILKRDGITYETTKTTDSITIKVNIDGVKLAKSIKSLMNRPSTKENIAKFLAYACKNK